LLNRALSYDTSLEDALKLGFLSFDATQVSASDVDYPLDVIVYQKNSFHVIEHRLTKDEMDSISKEWTNELSKVVANLSDDWMKPILNKQEVVV
jgi:putative proteasome-type protease